MVMHAAMGSNIWEWHPFPRESVCGWRKVEFQWISFGAGWWQKDIRPQNLCTILHRSSSLTAVLSPPSPVSKGHDGMVLNGCIEREGQGKTSKPVLCVPTERGPGWVNLGGWQDGLHTHRWSPIHRSTNRAQHTLMDTTKLKCCCWCRCLVKIILMLRSSWTILPCSVRTRESMKRLVSSTEIVIIIIIIYFLNCTA